MKMKRQKIRKLLLLISLLLFPVTIYYFSPYLIIMGALEGIISGSFIVFSVMLLGSIFLGRSFCGYLCPVGGMQECAFSINDKEPKQGFRNAIKYFIWAVWISIIAVCFYMSQKGITIDFFYQTDHGISVSNRYAYIIYYMVIALMFLPSVFFGKRIACHYFCWMAPFMVIGTKIREKLTLPGLRIRAVAKECVSCKQCNKNCPMSLDVQAMVQKETCKDSECILCGACVDVCPQKCLHYTIRREK